MHFRATNFKHFKGVYMYVTAKNWYSWVVREWSLVRGDKINIDVLLSMGPFFSRETIFVDFADFGIILKKKPRKLHGGYGQWPSEIGIPWNLNLQKHLFSKSAKYDSLEKKGPTKKKDLYGTFYYYRTVIEPTDVH